MQRAALRPESQHRFGPILAAAAALLVAELWAVPEWLRWCIEGSLVLGALWLVRQPANDPSTTETSGGEPDHELQEKIEKSLQRQAYLEELLRLSAAR